MIVALIAAVAADGGIGRGNELLFVDKADQQHFRATTMGHPVIMGRRTWESIPARFRPLPGRRNIVLSRDAGFEAPGAEVARDLDAALALAAGAGAERVFVCGGADVYAQALPRADELVLTEIGRAFDGADRFFPGVDRREFVEAVRRHATAADGTPLAFVVYRRAAPGPVPTASR